MAEAVAQERGGPGGHGARLPERRAKRALPFMSRNEAPAAPKRATRGGGLPVAVRVCRTTESSAEMMESSHFGRQPCAVLLQEAVTEKVRWRPGRETRVCEAGVLPGYHGAAAGP